RPRGKVRTPASELAALRREGEQLRRQAARQQALLRVTERTIGLAAGPAAPSTQAETKGCKKRRREPPGPAVPEGGRPPGGAGRALGQGPCTRPPPVGGRGPEPPPQARVNGDNGLSLPSQQVRGGPAVVLRPARDRSLGRIPMRGRKPSGPAAADRLPGSPLA